MHIAMIGQKGVPASYGGVERHVADLAHALVSAGCTVTVYSRSWYTKQTGKADVDGVSALHLPSIRTKHLDTITHTLVSTLHALFQPYDVVHYHGVGPALLSWLPKIFRPKMKVIVTFHSIDRYHQKWGLFARWFLRLGEWMATHAPDQTIVVSEHLKQYCLNEFQREAVAIPHIVSVSEQPPQNGIEAFGLRPKKYITMVSRLVPHKGAHLLIEAVASLKTLFPNDHAIQELKLAIVGGHVYTDDYVKELHRQASTCNDIVFTDFQTGETLDALYGNAMALVHPSLNEGLPLTVLHAMSMGTPVLVSNIPEHLEVIHDARALFLQNNVEAIRQALLDFLHLSTDERQRMGEKNKAAIALNYSREKVLPKLLEVYQNARNKKQPTSYKHIPVPNFQ